jgi:hypothetical protein
MAGGELVHDVLVAAGLQPQGARIRKEQRAALTAGAKLLPVVEATLSGPVPGRLTTAVRSLDLHPGSLPRLLGYGWLLTDGLAGIAGTPRGDRAAAARLGALFNLGVVLFDRICDRYPERRDTLFTQVEPADLEAWFAGSPSLPKQASGDPAVDVLTTLIAHFAARSLALGATARDRQAFAELIAAMYEAERSVTTRVSRTTTGPTDEVWQMLRGKSVLPMHAMAALALLPCPHGDETGRAATRLAADLAGDALWIVDDLADLGEDWATGCWSRPLWLLARRNGVSARSADEAESIVAASGIHAAEAAELADRLVRLERVTAPRGSSFLACVQAIVAAWLEELPG